MFLEINGATASQEATIRSILEGDQLTWDRRRILTEVSVWMADELDVPGDGVDNSAYAFYNPPVDRAEIYLERRLEADPAFFRRVIAHELGHIVIAQLGDTNRQWFSEEAFGKPFSEWQTGSWEQRPEEATAEAFADAFLVDPVARRNASRLRVPQDKWSEALTRFQSLAPPPNTVVRRTDLLPGAVTSTSPVFERTTYPFDNDGIPSYSGAKTIAIQSEPGEKHHPDEQYERIELEWVIEPVQSALATEFLRIGTAAVIHYTDGRVPGPGTPVDAGLVDGVWTSNIRLTSAQPKLVEWLNRSRENPLGVITYYSVVNRDSFAWGVTISGTVSQILYPNISAADYGELPYYVTLAWYAAGGKGATLAETTALLNSVTLTKADQVHTYLDVIQYNQASPPYPIYDVAGRIQAAPGPAGVVPR